VIDVTELMEADAKLRAALTRAEAASAAKSQFLATMSHELRTPLNAIIRLSEMIASEVMGPLGNARYADYVRDIHRAGRHLLELVTDVLDTSRIESGGYRLILAPLQAADVIEETHRIVAPLAAERGVRLERALEPDLPPIRGDRRALKRILINVMSNAVKYTPAGGAIAARARGRFDGLDRRRRHGQRNRARGHSARDRAFLPRRRCLHERRLGRRRARPLDRPRARRSAWRLSRDCEQARRRHHRYAEVPGRPARALAQRGSDAAPA
jgi:nitrogen-specific signal transduction histidine kinase